MTPPRILIAEDDCVQSALLLAAIEGRGYRADVVADGLEAIRRLRTGCYDLALLDYGLPEVDGLTAARLMQDFLAEGERPRLIAVTAAVERLQAKEDVCGVNFFDAVVPKRAGLAALLAVIDDNLVLVAETSRAASRARMLDLAAAASVQRKRRISAALAALPALAMTGAFTIAIYWAMSSLDHVQRAATSTRYAAEVTTDAMDLLGAVHDAESSQRVYLATGLEAHRGLFEGAAQHVDQLLVAAAPLTVEDVAGAAPVDAPFTIIEAWLRKLGNEIEQKQAVEVRGAFPIATAETGPAVTQYLNAWGSNLVDASQHIVLLGLDTVSGNIRSVLLVLALGVVCGLWATSRSVRRCWQEFVTPPGETSVPRLTVAPKLAIAMGERSSVSADPFRA